MRAKELAWCLFAKPLKENPSQALVMKRLAMLRRRLQLFPQEHADYEKRWRTVLGPSDGAPPRKNKDGPLNLVAYEVQKIGWKWNSPWWF